MSEKHGDIEITGILKGNSTVRASITKRPSHTVIYKISGESIYYVRGERLRLSAGTVLYIPEGESYSFEKISEGESLYHLVNFHCAQAPMEKPKLFSPSHSKHIEALFSRMEQSWTLFHSQANRYKILSLFYELLSILYQDQDRTYHTTAQRMKLSPALQYLDKNFCSHDLSVSALAELCGISTVTFRKLFEAQMGESPKKYIIRCRLTKAKTIIESGEFNSIQEVSYAVGYNDPLYFSRHFKQHFGISPSAAYMPSKSQGSRDI